jgi:GTP-binding protein
LKQWEEKGMSYKLVSLRLLSKKLMVKKCEPIEDNWFTRKSSGRAVEFVTMRKGEMLSMETKGERMIVKFNIPSRGIIGLRINCLLRRWGYYGTPFYRIWALQRWNSGRNKGSLISMEKVKQFLTLLINYKIVVSFRWTKCWNLRRSSNWWKLSWWWYV